jgi:hypothetical protein
MGIRRCALGFVNMYPGSIRRPREAGLCASTADGSRILTIFPSGAAYFLDSPVDFGDCALIVTGNISSP